MVSPRSPRGGETFADSSAGREMPGQEVGRLGLEPRTHGLKVAVMAWGSLGMPEAPYVIAGQDGSPESINEAWSGVVGLGRATSGLPTVPHGRPS